jgi:hypothetical protein
MEKSKNPSNPVKFNLHSTNYFRKYPERSNFKPRTIGGMLFQGLPVAAVVVLPNYLFRMKG